MDTTSETPQAAPSPPPPGQAPRRRLVRRVDDKVIAGVASGLGDYFDVDPVLFRIGFVILTFAGGAGLIAYGVAWLAMPPATGGPSATELAARRIRRPRDVPTWLAAILLIVGAALLAGAVGFRHPEVIWGVALIGLGVVLFHHATTEEPVARPAGDGPPLPPLEPSAGIPTGGVAPPSRPARPGDTAELYRPPPRPPRERSGLGWATVGAIFLVAGVAALLDNAGAISLSLAQFLALPLVVIAGGLLIGAWTGRARWLFVLGLVLVPAIVFASLVTVPFKGGFGERLYRPVTAADASHPYRLIAGRMTIDLSELQRGETPRTVTASAVAGEILVIAPPGVTVDAHGQVGAGELRLFGRWDNGLKLDQHVTRLRSGPPLRLDLAVSFGQIIVERR